MSQLLTDIRRQPIRGGLNKERTFGAELHLEYCTGAQRLLSGT